MSETNSNRIRAERKLLARIFSKIKVSTENFYKGVPCWEWQAYIHPKSGYGGFSLSKISGRAHRVIYQIFVERIPDALQCDHLCKVRHCVNPAHIEAVTAAINNARSESPAAINARKTHCPLGHPLTPDNIVKRKDRKARNCRICANNKAVIYAERKRRAAGVRQIHSTMCKNGHLYTPENTMWKRRESGIHRDCRKCKRIQQNKRYAEKKQLART